MKAIAFTEKTNVLAKPSGEKAPENVRLRRLIKRNLAQATVIPLQSL